MCIIKNMRIQLHRNIVGKLEQFGICPTPDVVENFKRPWLVHELKVETSKALANVEDLQEALNKLESVTEDYILATLMKKYEDKNRFVVLTIGQKKKLIKLSKYVLKLPMPKLRNYAEQTLGRKVWLFDLTKHEADILIKRLQKWEAKNEHANIS